MQSVSGTFDHKATITISGSGFGTKSQAAPVIWDDASGSSITQKWDVAWPNRGNSAYHMAYRAPQRGISLPHNNITRYLAGAHGDSFANGGGGVGVWKGRTIGAFPQYTYVSWYQRFDDAWVFNGNNLKIYDYTRGTGGYDLPNNWYIEYRDPPTSNSSTNAKWHILDDTGYPTGVALVDGYESWYGSGANNPMNGQWTKIEVEVKLTNQSDGYIKIIENGRVKMNYRNKTEGYSGNVRSDAVGGYSDMYGQPNNWRYFADVYLDYTPARVVLANNPALDLATIIEVQIPTAWSNSSITASVNLGKFTRGQLAYLFVVDGTGTHNLVGLPVTIGGASSAKTPAAPTSTSAN
jgi:hypothetical protein